MSTITNSSFKGGDTLSTTDINDKFQDIADATTAQIDASNIRDQSVDLAQMESETLNGKSGIQLVTLKYGDVGTNNDLTTNRSYVVNRTGTPLLDSGGAYTKLDVGVTLSTNDMLRVYYSGRCETTTTVSTSNATNQSNACWAFWLQWDITDATLTNWTEVPNQGDWSNQITGGRYAEPTDVVLSSTNGIASTAIVPHFYFTHDGGSETVRTYDKNNVNGTYYYKNTGSNVTIYGLRIVVGGVYRGVWEQNSGGTARRNYLEYTTNTSYVESSDTIDVYNMQISAIIQRTD